MLLVRERAEDEHEAMDDGLLFRSNFAPTQLLPFCKADPVFEDMFFNTVEGEVTQW